jgi:murein DD-endopeptidase MepM/ murein hydrolase activator NlpD
MLCIAAVGSVGYLSVKNIMSSTGADEWNKAAESADNLASQNEIAPTGKPTDGIKEKGTSSVSPSSSKAAVSSEAKKTTAVIYHMPTVGNIVTDFSLTAPVFSKTMGDWRIHSGIDIMGTKGQDVKASADGTVEDVYNDEFKGVTIVLAHSDGVKTVYCNLQEKVNVKKSQKVIAGDILGKIGNTASFESSDESHLHFEMIKNGIQLNPNEMFKN